MRERRTGLNNGLAHRGRWAWADDASSASNNSLRTYGASSIHACWRSIRRRRRHVRPEVRASRCPMPRGARATSQPAKCSPCAIWSDSTDAERARALHKADRLGLASLRHARVFLARRHRSRGIWWRRSLRPNQRPHCLPLARRLSPRNCRSSRSTKSGRDRAEDDGRPGRRLCRPLLLGGQYGRLSVRDPRIRCREKGTKPNRRPPFRRDAMRCRPPCQFRQVFPFRQQEDRASVVI